MAVLSGATGLLLVLVVAFSPVQADSVEVGDALPPISVAGAAGEAIELSFQEGEVVAIEFWASWCQACRHTLPLLAQLAEERRGDGFRAFAVNIDRSRSAADNYLAENPFLQKDSLTVVYDPGGDALARLGPLGLPALYVVEGRTVRLVQAGWKPDGEQRLRRVVDTLLRRKDDTQGVPACESPACSR